MVSSVAADIGQGTPLPCSRPGEARHLLPFSRVAGGFPRAPGPAPPAGLCRRVQVGGVAPAPPGWAAALGFASVAPGLLLGGGGGVAAATQGDDQSASRDELTKRWAKETEASPLQFSVNTCTPITGWRGSCARSAPTTGTYQGIP